MLEFLRKIIIEWFKNFFSKFRINNNQIIKKGEEKFDYIKQFYKY